MDGGISPLEIGVAEMTTSIEFTTPGGTRFVVAIVTSETNLADHTVTNAVYRLSVVGQRHKDGRPFGGPVVFGQAAVVAHPQVGPALKISHNDYAPIPADKVEPLRALIAEYRAELARRSAAALAAATAYEAQHDLVERVRTTGRA